MHSKWNFEQVTEVLLVDEMYCMYLASEKLTIYCKLLNDKQKNGWGGVLLNELKYLKNAIDIYVE